MRMEYDYNAIISPKGKLLYACPAALELERVNLEDVAGITLWEGPWFARTPNAPGMIRKLAQFVHDTGKPKTIEITLKMLTGTRALEYTIAPVMDTTGRLVALKPEVDNQDKYVLNRKEREVLHWSARGKTAYEIGVILNLSQRTVEWRIDQARQKLDTVTLPQTIAVAIKRGCIVPSLISAGLGFVVAVSKLQLLSLVLSAA